MREGREKERASALSGQKGGDSSFSILQSSVPRDLRSCTAQRHGRTTGQTGPETGPKGSLADHTLTLSTLD